MLRRTVLLAIPLLCFFGALTTRAEAACPAQTLPGDVTLTTSATWCGPVTVLGNLVVANGVTLTLNDAFEVSVLGDMTVQSGAVVSADGFGYAAGVGPGKGANSNSGGGGGGHGGRGGNGNGAVGGAVHDAGLLPVERGSGGGSGAFTAGATGGGVIQLRVAGALTIDGTVSANGASSAAYYYGGTGGGGAGGTIRIKAGTLAGGGVLRANGGSAGGRTAGTDYGTGGGGAGGRIVVRAGTLAFTNFAGAQVQGGARGGNSSYLGANGGRGTIVVVQLDPGADLGSDLDRSGDRTVGFYSGWRFEPADAPLTFDALVFHPGTLVVGAGGATAVTATSLVATDATWDLTSDGASAVTGDLTLTVDDLSLVGTTVTVAGTLAAHTERFSQVGGLLTATTLDLVGPDVSFGAGAAVNAATVRAEVALLSVAATALISTDGRGYGPSLGPGKGANSGNSGAGGGHGGRGGNGHGAVAGAYYDSGLLPTEMGSGGGSGAFTAGGAGGGVIRLLVSDTLTLDGTLSANGASSSAYYYGGTGGGGAGGTVRIKAASIVGAGLLRANGGSAGGRTAGTDYGTGGGGAGGRVLVRAQSIAFTNLAGAQVSGGARGGNSSYLGVNGGRGTIALVHLDATADLGADLDRAGDRELDLYQGWRFESVDAPLAFDRVTVFPGTQIVGSGANTTLTTPSFSMEGATWNNAVDTFGGCDGACETVGDVTLIAAGAELSLSGLVAGTTGGWRFEVAGDLSLTSSTLTGGAIAMAIDGIFTQDGGTTSATTLHLAGPDFAFIGSALAEASSLTAVVTDLLVTAAATLSTDGRGYGPSQGPGKGASSGNSGGGGGHGGRGGNGHGAAAGAYYDSGLLPTDMGSGGGSGAFTAGATGGGLVQLLVAGTLTLDGTISSNGASSVAYYYGGTGGGGSGGTVRIKAATFGGGGLLRANGGSAGGRTAGTDYGSGGGGSGGRIVVRSKSATFTNLANAQVSGGARGGNTSYPGVNGGRGTLASIVLDPAADLGADSDRSGDRSVHLYQGWRFEPATDAPLVFDALVIHPGTEVVGAGVPVTVTAASLVADGARWDTTVSSFGGCNGTCPATGDLRLDVGTIALTGQTVTVGNANDLTIDADQTFVQSAGSLTAASVHLLGPDFTFQSGALVDASSLLGTVDDLRVLATAVFRTDARGYGPSLGPGKGANSGNAGAGAGHGGRGGNGHGAQAGAYYDSGLLPADKGSGGGSGAFTAGGAGGGLIELLVLDTLTLDGTLSANGDDSVAHYYGGTGGGGAGGTLRIKAATFAGAGLLRANGGSAGGRSAGTDYGTGGGGAGGRIVVRTKDLAFTNLAGTQVNGGARGGNSSYLGSNGGRGTAAFVSLDGSASLASDASAADDLALTLVQGWRFEAGDAPFYYDRVSLTPGVVVVSAGADVTVDTDELVAAQSIWRTTIDSFGGCNGTCASMGDVNLLVRTATLAGATFDGGTSEDWHWSINGELTQTDGAISGGLVRMTGDVPIVLLGAATLTAKDVEIDAASLSLAAPSKLSALTLGFAPGQGPGLGANSGNGGGGGGHGGKGGNGHNATGGASYDPPPPTEPCVAPPSQYGSGGGSGAFTAGAPGGGRIDITLSGAFEHDGLVTADGGASAAYYYGGTGGGGAGGTVRVACGALSGSGTFRGVGGASGAYSASTNYGGGGGGGGGRIFIEAAASGAWAGHPVTNSDTAYVAGGAPGYAAGLTGIKGDTGSICFADRHGPPVIAPSIAPQSLFDAAPLVLDLSAFENDFEDGPGGDGNGLTWSVSGVDPATFSASIDLVSDRLTLTSIDPLQPWSGVVTLTVTDLDGLTDTQALTVTHEVTPYQLTLAAVPATLPGDGSSTSELMATLTSPLGWSVASKAITFSIVSGGGFLPRSVDATSAAGVATVEYVAPVAVGPVTVAASFTINGRVMRAETTLQLETSLPDLAAFTLDITFHDPITGAEIVPGDIDPVTAGELIEVRALIRNLGGMPTPAASVVFEDARVSFSPPGVGAAAVVGSTTAPPLDVGASATVAIQTAFLDDGFHTMTVRIDPDELIAEGREDNNRATQGFWIGTPVLGVDLVATSCDLDTVLGLEKDGLPATTPGGTVRIWGRADYGPFLPFDPDHSLGIAAVKGGIVKLSLETFAGAPVTLISGGVTVMPIEGDHSIFRALHTIGTVPGSDKTAVGQYPNRSTADRWSFAAPTAFGCYRIEVCVSDTSFEGCCPQEFCVVPQGPDLACTSPVLPTRRGAEVAPVVGDGDMLTSTITNRGDTAAYGAKVRLLVDGVATGTPVTLAAVEPGASQLVSFPWTPACEDANVAVQIDWDNAIAERDESNNTCQRKTPELLVAGLGIAAVTACTTDVSLAVTNLGGMAIGAWDSNLVVTRPDGSTVMQANALSGAGSFGLLNDLLIDQTGDWTFAVAADVPIDLGAGQCGAVPEAIEATNNVASRTVRYCADPSPWKDPRGANYLAHQLVIDIDLPSVVTYGTPTTVSARIANRGNMTLSVPLEVLLTSEHGRVLETTGDLVTIANSCADPLEPGASKTVSWTWTPRYRGPEVRELRVVVDPNDQIPECDEANNETTRGLDMDLTPWRSAPSANWRVGPPDFATPDLAADVAPTFLAPVVVSGYVFNRTPYGRVLVVPNSEGGQTRFSLTRRSGAELAVEHALITSPSPASPQPLAFAWTPDALACDVSDPVQEARVEVDDGAIYAESSETNQVTTLHLPDLVPTDISLTTRTCSGDFYFAVKNAAPLPAMAVGSFKAQLTLTTPDGVTTTYPVTGPFTGTGSFLVATGIDTSQQGAYVATIDVDIDGPTACGALPERDEENNRYTETIVLCPDPSPRIVAIDITADGPVQYDVPVGITARVHNYGNNSISKPVEVLLTSELGPGLETDAANDIKTVVNSCADPIDPGEVKTVTWTWVPSHDFDLRKLRAIVDPNDLEPAECSELNNDTERDLWLDLSPWKDYRAANFIDAWSAIIDIDVDGPPGFGEALGTTHYLFNRGPVGWPWWIDYPLLIVPNGGDDAWSRTVVRRRSGAEELIADDGILAPSPSVAQTIERDWTPLPDQCDTLDPIQTVRVRVDDRDYFRENVEGNNITDRQLPNLAVNAISMGLITANRADLSYSDRNLGDHTVMAVGEHVASGRIDIPSGPSVDLGTVGPFAGTGAHGLASGVLFRENGTYQVTVTTDPPQVDNACGDLPERDELDNTSIAPFTVCPDVTPSLSFGGPLVYEVPVPVTVAISNIGSNTLIEDVRVTLVAERAEDGQPATLDLDAPERVASFDFGAGLERQATTTVTFTWTPRQNEQVKNLRAVLEVLDTDLANGAYAIRECRYDNNTDEQPIHLDLTPWRHPCGESYLTLANPREVIDLLVDRAPVNGEALVTTSRIRNYGNITPDHADVLLRELRGNWYTAGDDLTTQPAKFAPPAGGGLDSALGWTPRTLRQDPHALGPLWGVQVVVDRDDLLTELAHPVPTACGCAYGCAEPEANNTTRRLLVDLVPVDIELPYSPCVGSQSPARGFATSIVATIAKPLPPPGLAIPELPLSPYHVSLFIDGVHYNTTGPYTTVGTKVLATGVVFDTIGDRAIEIRIDEDPDTAARENLVPERNEDNNRRSETFYVHEPVPNLSVWAAPDRARQSDLGISAGELGQPVRVSGRVYNRGEIASGAFLVRLLIDGVPTAETTIPGPLAVDDSIPVELVWPAATLGDHSATLVVDPRGEIAECSDGDNASAAPFRIRAPEVCVDGIVLAGSPLAVGDVVSVRGAIDNQGGSTATEVRGRVRLQTHLGTVEVGTFRIASLPPGARVIPMITPNTSLPVPARPLPDGGFEWTIGAPSVGIQTFVYDITSTSPVNALGSCPGSVSFELLPPDDQDPNDPEGCAALFVEPADSWFACASGELAVRLVHPQSGTPVEPSELESLAITLTTNGLAIAPPLGLSQLSYRGQGVYAATVALAADKTDTAVDLHALAVMKSGFVCQDGHAVDIAPGDPDLFVYSDDILFLAKNGDPTPFVQASVGDDLVIGMSVHNAEGACTAIDVEGRVYLQLGFAEIDLGTFFIDRIAPGETAGIPLTANGYLPRPPTPLAAGTFGWRVTAPSPWLDVFTVEITDSAVPDSTPLDNAATKALLVGNFGLSDGCELVLAEPGVDAVWYPDTTRPVSFELSDDAGHALAPADLERLAVFVIDSAGEELALIDALAADAYLGAGRYSVDVDLAATLTPADGPLAVRVVAHLLEGGCGDERDVLIEERPPCACVAGDECLQEGDFSSTCAGPEARRQCVAGDLVAVPCGTDRCADDGDGFGAGTCAATDWSCQAGACVGAASGGVDVCLGGESLRTFVCNAAGNACQASETWEDDACVADGGACTAVDWACVSDGGPAQLERVTSAGTDRCEGDADHPVARRYGCVARDGDSLDTCGDTTVGQHDGCVDDGSDRGGGSCVATDWRCERGVLVHSDSGGSDSCGDGSNTQTGTYVCATSDGALPDTCVARPDTTAPTLSVTGPTGFQCPAALELATASDLCDADLDVTWSPTADLTGRTSDGRYTATWLPEGCLLDVTVSARDDAGHQLSASAPDVCLDCTAPDTDLELSEDPDQPTALGSDTNLELGNVFDPTNPGWSGLASASFTLTGDDVDALLTAPAWQPTRPVGDLLGGPMKRTIACDDAELCQGPALDIGRLPPGEYMLEVTITDVAGNTRTRTFYFVITPVLADFWCSPETLALGAGNGWISCWCTVENDGDHDDRQVDPRSVYIEDAFENVYAIDLGAPWAVLQKGFHFKVRQAPIDTLLGHALDAAYGPGWTEQQVAFTCHGTLRASGTDAGGFFASDPGHKSGHGQAGQRPLRVLDKRKAPTPFRGH